MAIAFLGLVETAAIKTTAAVTRPFDLLELESSYLGVVGSYAKAGRRFFCHRR